MKHTIAVVLGTLALMSAIGYWVGGEETAFEFLLASGGTLVVAHLLRTTFRR